MGSERVKFEVINRNTSIKPCTVEVCGYFRKDAAASLAAQLNAREERMAELTAENRRLSGIINFASSECFRTIRSMYSTGHQIEFAEKMFAALSTATNKAEDKEQVKP